MAACPAFDPTGPYVGNLVSLVDCHSLALGEEGWRAIATGSGFGLAFGGLLTIYLALLGYRTLLGELPSVRNGVSAAVRIGMVLALATQWSAFRPLVYDVATRGPDEIAGSILSPSGLGGADRAGLYQRVQAVNLSLGALLQSAAADAALAAAAPPAAGGGNRQDRTAVPAPSPVGPDLRFEAAKAVALANQLLLVSTAAGAISVRIVIALLLALAPLFAACLLFDTTRGLFAGWLRVLSGAALGAVAVSAVTALELAIIEPQTLALGALLDAGRPLGALPDEMQATTAVFALVMLAALLAMARATAGFRLQDQWSKGLALLSGADRWRTPVAVPNPVMAQPAATSPEPNRAALIADAARAAERRDAQSAATIRILQQTEPLKAGAASSGFNMVNVPLGQSGRRTTRRPGRLAARRDDRG